jgi:hypothetical protein
MNRAPRTRWFIVHGSPDLTRRQHLHVVKGCSNAGESGTGSPRRNESPNRTNWCASFDSMSGGLRPPGPPRVRPGAIASYTRAASKPLVRGCVPQSHRAHPRAGSGHREAVEAASRTSRPLAAEPDFPGHDRRGACPPRSEVLLRTICRSTFTRPYTFHTGARLRDTGCGKRLHDPATARPASRWSRMNSLAAQHPATLRRLWSRR